MAVLTSRARARATAAPRRPRRRPGQVLARVAMVVVLAGAAVFLLAPLVVVMASAFTSSGLVEFPPSGFSLKWFPDALGTSAFRDGLYCSLQLGVVTAIVGAVIGIITGRTLATRLREGQRSASWNLYLFTLPLSVPSIVIGVGSLGFWSRLGVSLGFIPLLIGHLVLTLPYAIRTMTVAFQQIDPRLELAASSLGASAMYTIRRVLLPLAAPGLISTLALVFLVSFDDVAVSLFLAAPGFTPLPVTMFAYLDQSITPALSAISAMVAVGSIILLVVVDRLVGLGRLFGISASR